jgi:hypothetical protein
VKFLVDSMLPPRVADLLVASGHDAVTPDGLGAHNLPDDVLVQHASRDGRVIVTENAVDFAQVTTCTVLLVRKAWWPTRTLAERIATAVDRWATSNPDPGLWAHWLTSDLR